MNRFGFDNVIRGESGKSVHYLTALQKLAHQAVPGERQLSPFQLTISISMTNNLNNRSLKIKEPTKKVGSFNFNYLEV
jgi:hypothetical protein